MRIPKKGTWLNKLKYIVNGKNLDKKFFCLSIKHLIKKSLMENFIFYAVP